MNLKNFNEEEFTHLQSFKNKNTFGVPNNYFEELPLIITNKCNNTPNRNFSYLLRKNTVKYVVGFFSITFIVGSFLLLNKYHEVKKENQFVQWSSRDISSYEMEEFELLYLDEGDDEDTTITKKEIYSLEQSISENQAIDSISLNNNSQVIQLKDISNDEILKYLEDEDLEDDF